MSKKNSSDKENLATALCAGEYKVIIIGGLGVGKTSLLLRYVHDTFEDRVSRFVAEEKKAVTVGGQEIILDIWDTAGQERFQSITNRFYSDSQAVIIVYDTTSDDSLQDIDFWVREVQYYLLKELEDGMPVIFVGNKKDLLSVEAEDQSASVFKQVQEISNANGFLRPVECSAKTGENVDKIFDIVASELTRRKMVKPLPSSSPNVVTSTKPCSACTT